MEADLALIVLLVGAFVVGYLRGAVRQLIVLGTWVVLFIASAHLRPVVGDFIADNMPQYSGDYIDMLAFLSTFLILFPLAVAAIELRGATVQLTRRQVFDEILGGLLALGWMLFAIATVAIGLDSFYLLDAAAGADEIGFVRDLYSAFERSGIVRYMHESLIPALLALLGPLLPADIRAVYG